MKELGTPEDRDRSQWVRLSVVVGHELAEHVRVQAFLTRKSRSAYVRGLIEDDAARVDRGSIFRKGEIG